MEEFEKMLYEISEEAADNSAHITDRIGPIKNTCECMMYGIILVLINMMCITNNKILHVFLIIGAYFLMIGTNACKYHSKTMLVAHLSWTGVLAGSLMYEICYVYNAENSTDILRDYIMGRSYQYGYTENIILSVLLSFTIISFVRLMIKMIKDSNRVDIAGEYLYRGMFNFLEEILIMIVIVNLKMKGIIVFLALIPLLVSGDKNMNEGIANVMYFGSRITDIHKNGKKRKIYMSADIVTVFFVLILTLGFVYYPYISRRYGEKTNETEYLDETHTFVEIDKHTEDVKESLIQMGVREEILMEMLPKDILKLDNTKRVLKSDYESELSYYQGKELKTIKYKTTLYACEIFNGYESNLKNNVNPRLVRRTTSDGEDVEIYREGSYVYEMLVYIEFPKDNEFLTDIDELRFDSQMGDYYNTIKYPNENNTWVYLTDVKGITKYYKGEYEDNKLGAYGFGRNIARAKILEGSNFRAYSVEPMYMDINHGSVYASRIFVSVDAVKKGKYFDYRTGRVSYENIDYIASSKADFMMKVLYMNRDDNVDGWDNKDDYYDDGYDKTKEVNISLINFYRE